MRCEKIQELLPAYTEEDVSEGEKKLIRQHVDTCGLCATILSYLRRADAHMVALPATSTDMRSRQAKIDAAVLREVRRGQRTPVSRLRWGRTLNLAGLAVFVLILSAGAIGLARTLSRMEPRPSTPGTVACTPEQQAKGEKWGCEDAVVGLRPSLIVVKVERGVSRYRPGTERFTEIARGADAVLRQVNGRVAESETYGSNVNLRRNGDEEFVEVLFPEPGVRLGGHGPYTKAFIPLEIPGSVTTIGTDLWIALGNRRYSHMAGARAPEELDSLRERLGMRRVHEPDISGMDPDHAEIQSVVDAFKAAASDYINNATKKQSAAQANSEARAQLATEYSAQVEDLRQLGIPTSLTTGGGNSVGTYRNLRADDEHATITSVQAFHRDGTWTQNFALRKLNREWRITGIEKAVAIPLEEALEDEQLLAFEQEKIKNMVWGFYQATGLSLRTFVSESDSPGKEAEARAYLAPGYDSGIDDLRRLLSIEESDRDAAFGVRNHDTRIDGTTATDTVQLNWGDTSREIRFRFQHLDNQWKITAIEQP